MSAEPLSTRQLLALSYRAKRQEPGDSQFARGVNDTADWLAKAIRVFGDDLRGLAGHLRARVRGGTRWEKSRYEDGVAAVLDDVEGILDGDPGTINDIIEYGRGQRRAEKEA